MEIRMTISFMFYLYFGVAQLISLWSPKFALKIMSFPHSTSPESWQWPVETLFV